MTTTTDISSDLREFIDNLHQKINGHATKGDTEPFLELWSHGPDASIMAAVGGYHVGFGEVSKLLLWVSARMRVNTYTFETLTAHEADELAASVSLEHLTSAEGQKTTLRSTHVYRREDGAWKLLHRHAEELTDVREM